MGNPAYSRQRPLTSQKIYTTLQTTRFQIGGSPLTENVDITTNPMYDAIFLFIYTMTSLDIKIDKTGTLTTKCHSRTDIIKRMARKYHIAQSKSPRVFLD